MNTKTIEVRAARTQFAVVNHQCDIVDSFDTIGEARRAAKYYLTDSYQQVIESSEPMRYSQVVVNSECVADFFRKGYSGLDA